MNRYCFAYRGQITGLLTRDHDALIITAHPEQQATALYRFNFSSAKPALTQVALPSDATALCAFDADQVAIAGRKGQVWLSGWQDQKLKPLAIDLSTADAPIIAMQRMQDVLLLLQARRLVAWHIPSQTQQVFELAQSATCLAVSADQLWLAVGDQAGGVHTYEYREQLVWSASAPMHQAAVTAIVFEPQQQRFFSTGLDLKLYSTHAQGELQALDKGRSSMHSQVVNDLICVGERLYSASADKTVKSWPLAGGNPNSCQKNLLGVQRLAAINIQGAPHLLTVNHDQSLRTIALDRSGKLGEVVLSLYDGYAWLKEMLASSDPSDVKVALATLRQYNDRPALQLLAETLKKSNSQDQVKRLLEVLIDADHPDSGALLEDVVKNHKTDDIRLSAYQALSARALQRPDPLQHSQIALATQHSGLARQALADLLRLTRHTELSARQQARANQLIRDAINHSQADVRLLALYQLEQLESAHEYQSAVLALNSKFSDTQRAGLIRLMQRQLLGDLEIKRQIVALQEHRDVLLRHSAFWVAIFSHPELAAQLHARDAEFSRPLQELAQFQLTEQQPIRPLTLPKASKAALSAEQLEPLLQGLSNRFADLSFAAAYGLALLQDPRAFGILLLLSQDKEVSIRRGVAQAFAALQLPDSQATLSHLLNDPDSSVRDAAFMALTQLEKNPLRLAELGFASKQQDIHALALKTLLDHLTAPSQVGVLERIKQGLQRLQGQAPVDDSQAALTVLTQALNDPFEAIRIEAAKACLNRQLAGDRPSTLLLLLNSQYQNLHLDVLNEWMAQYKNSASQMIDLLADPLLARLIHDPFEPIRQQTFHFLTSEKKRFDPLAVLRMALGSEYLDVRRAALKHIQQERRADTHALLSLLLSDSDSSLRVDALNAALQLGQRDALHAALSSTYSDIQLAAAQALAKQGDVAAFVVFERFLQQPCPELDSEKTLWLKQVRAALSGLALLGDPRGFAWLVDYLARPQVDVAACSEGLVWMARAEHVDQLAAYLTDTRTSVAANAALALAVHGDARAWPALTTHSKTWSAAQHLMALNGLAAIHHRTLEPLLAQKNALFASQLLLVSQPLICSPNKPSEIIQGLSSRAGNTALLCAGLLACYHQQAERWAYLTQYLNHISKQDTPKWSVSVEQLQQLAAVLVYAPATVKARAISLLLVDEHTSFSAWQLDHQRLQQRDQAAWQQALAAAQSAYAPLEISAAQVYQWQSLAFGASLGVIRQSEQSIASRHSAIRQLLWLGEQQPLLHDSVERCLSPLLNHDLQEIRQFAFEQLRDSGMDHQRLAELAMTSVRSDIATQGLNLAIAQLTPDNASHKLNQLMQTSSPILSVEAYRLQRQQHSALQVAPIALQSYYVPLRTQALNELRPEIKQPAVQQCVVGALGNSDPATVLQAFVLLAEVQYPALAPMLISQLQQSTDEQQQLRLLSLLRRLNDGARINPQLLAYLDHPERRVNVRPVLQTIAHYRDVAIVPALLQRLSTQKSEIEWIIDAVVNISGYDQPLYDRDDEQADQSWRERQYPRHDHVLTALFKALLAEQSYARAVDLLGSLAWAHSNEVDAVLIAALQQMPATHHVVIVTAMAKRADKRQGALTGLQTALGLNNPDVQFLAAEALAKRGQAHGISILLTAIDHNPQGSWRQRAVLALGELGDQRAFDKLLKLAEEQGHFLQGVASEALGHLAHGEHAARILRLLKQALSQVSPYSDQVESILRGLRWLNLPESWLLIRGFIQDSAQHSYYQSKAIALLKHHDSPANRQLLLDLLERSDDELVVDAAYNTAQWLWGNQDTAVYDYDVAVLQGAYPLLQEQRSLTCVTTYASTTQLLALLKLRTLDADVRAALKHALLQREDLSDTALHDLLSQPEQHLIELAAQYLAAHHQHAQLAGLLDQVIHQTTRLSQTWQRLESITARSMRQQHEAEHSAIACSLNALWWVVARFAASNSHTDALIAGLFAPMASTANSYVATVHQWQQIVLTALLSRAVVPHTWQQTLQGARHVISGELSVWLDQLTPTSSPQGDLYEQLLHLIAQGQHQRLAQIAQDATQIDAIRLGAIEGLGQITHPEIEGLLTHLTHAQDSDLAKAAFRVLRRYQRRQARMAGV